MENINRGGDRMIQLYQSFNQESQDLYFSLDVSGIQSQATVVLDDNGFLPKGLESPYSFFCGYTEDMKQNPLFFNEVVVPEFWEIVGSNSEASIYDYHHLRGKIHFCLPTALRNVEYVEWLDEDGSVRIVEHYNQYGFLFYREFFNKQNQKQMTAYFDKEEKECITVHHNTGDIILNDEKIHIFQSLNEFLTYYFNERGFDTSQIVYNNLGNPFMYCHYSQQEGQDLIFWQEEIKDAVPGNLLVALSNNHHRSSQVFVQSRNDYEKMMELLDEDRKKRVQYLGYIYPNRKNPNYGKHAFILTNSDQILACEQIVKECPDLHIHIAALTEMSSQLMAMDQYSNVSLYPNIRTDKIEELLQTCDYYLDINHYNEVLTICRQAFEHQMLIVAFDSTIHQRKYVPTSHIFDSSQSMEMIELLKQCMEDKEQFDNELEIQLEFAQLEDPKSYQKVLKPFVR